MSLPAIRPPGGHQPISYEMLELSKINENPNNARKHSRRQLAALKRSIDKFGAITPAVVDENDQLICGQARISAARALGLRTFPVIRVGHLSERQKRALMLADNRIAQLAAWDEAALRHELEFLIQCDLDFDFPAIGFSACEVNYILERADDRRRRTKKRRQSIRAPVISTPDDVWRLGDHLLRCGESHPEQVDYIIRRWQAETGADAINSMTGETFGARERDRRDQ